MKKIILIATFLMITACSTPYPNQQLVGQQFPAISGSNLNKEEVKMPDNVLGKPALFLVGYVQDTQFDIDRWLIGLDMKEVDVVAYELPAIAGMFPRMFSTKIDNGMRRGIPKELWGGVITIYKDGEKVQQFTGNENPNNARVMFVDAKGKIVYFYDRALVYKRSMN